MCPNRHVLELEVLVEERSNISQQDCVMSEAKLVGQTEPLNKALWGWLPWESMRLFSPALPLYSDNELHLLKKGKNATPKILLFCLIYKYYGMRPPSWSYLTGHPLSVSFCLLFLVKKPWRSLTKQVCCKFICNACYVDMIANVNYY